METNKIISTTVYNEVVRERIAYYLNADMPENTKITFIQLLMLQVGTIIGYNVSRNFIKCQHTPSTINK